VYMKKYISEFIGTFALIFCGTGAMTINEVTGGDVTHVGIAITWGFIVIAMIYTFGDISGAHFNPAVSIAFAFAKKGSKEVGIVAGIVIGGVVLLEAMFAGPVTNASMNPARSLAPALVSGHLEHLWLYILAPIIGAVLAISTCKLVKDDQCCAEDC